MEAPVARALPLGTRLWQQGWLRKGLILALLAAAWEVLARIQNNDLLLPSFTATLSALAEGLADGELVEGSASPWRSWRRVTALGSGSPSG